MQSALKPYATAGVAILGAGFLTVAPIAAPGSNPGPNPALARDLALAADGSPFGDFLTPWIDQYNTAAENATVLANNFFLAPGVGIQQALANQGEFWDQLLSDPQQLAELTLPVQENLTAVIDAFTLLNASSDVAGATTLHTTDASDLATLEFGHDVILQLLPQFLPDDIDPDEVTPIVNFLASPASAILIGALGPSISPWVALLNGINDGDGFNEILANMVGAFFNGATLNLDSLVLPLLEDADIFPEGTELNHVEFAFGGLFSSGDVTQAPYELFDSNGDSVAEIPAVGGSIFNSLGATLVTDAIGQSLTIDLAGQPVGPIAAWEAWSQTVAGILDGGKGASPWAWDGKNGGTPPPAEPPLTGASFPLIDDEIFDGSTIPDTDPGSAAADAAALADLLAAWGV